MITIPTSTMSTQFNPLKDRMILASETADDDNDTDTTVSSSINSVSPVSSIDKQLSSSCSMTSQATNSNKDQQSPRRRSIFDTYWEKSNSSSSIKDDSCNDVSISSPGGRRSSSQQAAKLQPSYLGVYKFASHSPLISPKPATLSPISIGSPDCVVLTPSSDLSHPKSILRRHKSFHKHISDHDEVGNTPDIAPPPFSNVSKPSSQRRSIFGDIVSKAEIKRASKVNFDPTITVRECLGDGSFNSQESWYQEDELQTFMTETINVCYSSAVKAMNTYSLPAVKKACDTAHKAGIKSPVLSSTHSAVDGGRALFTDPALSHADDADTLVCFGSKKFFKILSKEIQHVLIVDTSSSTLKLLKRHILCMFPHAKIHTALSGEEALDKIDGETSDVRYDLVIVEEHLDDSTSLLGSELLQSLSESENTPPSRKPSLKIGVSVSLGEDCQSFRKGGADLFWSKPPPKPSNCLRNQVLNLLLSKRGKSIHLCGC